jgi:3-oxoacyl-[acyl-carrier protein] reductase
MNLTDKIALVTGSSKGIGKSIALTLAKYGCNVAVNYAHDDSAAQSLVEEIRSLNRKAIAVKADVANANEVENMVDAVLKEFNTIDILVNNAGLHKDDFLVLMTNDSWHSVIETNLTGVFNCCKIVSKTMIGNRYGKIINVSSISGIIGLAGQTNYAAAKAGIIGFTKSLAKELAHFKVLVNAIAPGLVDTEMIKNIPEKNLKQMLDNIPLKRLGKPEEIAEVVAFLASDVSSYITGEVITVSGGL